MLTAGSAESLSGNKINELAMNRSSNGNSRDRKMPTAANPLATSRKRAIGLSIVALTGFLGILGVAAPSSFVQAVSFFQTPPMLYIAAGLRVLVGAGLAWAASVSRLPRLLLILGVIIAIGGLVTPLVGTLLARPILDSWAAGGPGWVRLWGAASLALAAFLGYNFSRRTSPVTAS